MRVLRRARKRPDPGRESDDVVLRVCATGMVLLRPTKCYLRIFHLEFFQSCFFYEESFHWIASASQQVELKKLETGIVGSANSNDVSVDHVNSAFLFTVLKSF